MSVCMSVHSRISFCYLTLVFSNQIWWNFYTMLITSKHKFELGWCHFHLSRACWVLLLYKWKNWWIFCFHSVTLVCLNQMFWIFIQNAYYRKKNTDQVWILLGFTNGKIAEFFVSVLSFEFAWTKGYETYKQCLLAQISVKI